MASLSILGLRPSLLCVHFAGSGGARIPEARAWSHAAQPARVEFSLQLNFPRLLDVTSVPASPPPPSPPA